MCMSPKPPLINQTALTLQFNFASDTKPGYIQVQNHGELPAYDKSRGWGFVRETCAVPPRPVQWDGITAEAAGFYAAATEFDAPAGLEQEHYNRFGMAFRMRIPPRSV